MAGVSGRDLPVHPPQRYAVEPMERARGWELYPQHRRFLAAVTQERSRRPTPHDGSASPEWSANEGILCERFVMGTSSSSSSSSFLLLFFFSTTLLTTAAVTCALTRSPVHLQPLLPRAAPLLRLGVGAGVL